MIMVFFNGLFALASFGCFIWMLEIGKPGPALLNLSAVAINLFAIYLHFHYLPVDQNHTASFIDKSANQIHISRSYS